MLKKTLSLFVLCWCFIHRVDAQLANHGQLIAISDDAWVSIEGDYEHNKGEVLNDGHLFVSGDWINNDAHSSVFNTLSKGKVEFNGDNMQDIGGGNKTVFSSVSLTGAGVKILSADMDITNHLNIGNQKLDANSHNVAVLNSDVNAIERLSGIVSTSKKGKLIRNIGSSGLYLFPVGALLSDPKTSDQSFYRPLEIEIKDSSPNMFSVSLVSEDPTVEGYDRNSKRKDIQNISDKYFYLLNHESGTSAITARLYRNTTIDGNSNQLVSWSKTGLWEKAGPSTKKEGAFGDGLNQYLVFSSAEPITDLPISFADYLTDKDNIFTFFNAFSPDGDGKNDTWKIQNLEYFPKNNLTIFNRWGDEVYKVAGYDSSKEWDGGSQSPGTYYYILNVEVNGQMKTYKGFITMMKKE